MPELTRPARRIINAVLDRKGEYVRIADWEGEFLAFILADEISAEEKPDLAEQMSEQK